VGWIESEVAEWVRNRCQARLNGRRCRPTRTPLRLGQRRTSERPDRRSLIDCAAGSADTGTRPKSPPTLKNGGGSKGAKPPRQTPVYKSTPSAPTVATPGSLANGPVAGHANPSESQRPGRQTVGRAGRTNSPTSCPVVVTVLRMGLARVSGEGCAIPLRQWRSAMPSRPTSRS
jgi:hypothetical protein